MHLRACASKGFHGGDGQAVEGTYWGHAGISCFMPETFHLQVIISKYEQMRNLSTAYLMADVFLSNLETITVQLPHPPSPQATFVPLRFTSQEH